MTLTPKTALVVFYPQKIRVTPIHRVFTGFFPAARKQLFFALQVCLCALR